MSLRDEIEKYLSAREYGNDCWMPHGQSGYAYLRIRGKSMRATRYIMELILGRKLQHYELVLHKCDNPRCLNPNHLYIGDEKQNRQDYVERLHGTRKVLNDAERRDIISKHQEGRSALSIAKEYDVPKGTIVSVINSHQLRELKHERQEKGRLLDPFQKMGRTE